MHSSMNTKRKREFASSALIHQTPSCFSSRARSLASTVLPSFFPLCPSHASSFDKYELFLNGFLTSIQSFSTPGTCQAPQALAKGKSENRSRNGNQTKGATSWIQRSLTRPRNGYESQDQGNGWVLILFHADWCLSCGTCMDEPRETLITHEWLIACVLALFFYLHIPPNAVPLEPHLIIPTDM